eukprot:2458505-Pleurochrysis_carterae.AAC.1
MPAAALSARFHLADSDAIAAAAALHEAASAAAALRDALLADTSPSAADFALWAERIVPIDPNDLPPALMASLSPYSDARFRLLPFTRVRSPIVTAYLPRSPPQPSRSAHCPSSAMDLLLPQAASKLEEWMRATL